MRTAGSSNANEAIKLSIVQADETSPKTLSSFHPQFTYPIFGEEERIFGYQGLKIHLRLAAHDAYPNIEISYDKKFKAVGETTAADIGEVLKDWVPASKIPYPPQIILQLLSYEEYSHLREACQLQHSGAE